LHELAPRASLLRPHQVLRSAFHFTPPHHPLADQGSTRLGDVGPLILFVNVVVDINCHPVSAMPEFMGARSIGEQRRKVCDGSVSVQAPDILVVILKVCS